MQINIGSERGHKSQYFWAVIFWGVFSSVVVMLILDFGGGVSFGVVGDGNAAVDFWDLGNCVGGKRGWWCWCWC